MFCLFALPRSKQFSNCVQDPSNWVLGPRAALTVQVGRVSYPPLQSWPLLSRVCCESTVPGVLCVSSWELMSGCDPLGRCQLFRVPGRHGWQLGACSQFGGRCSLWGQDCINPSGSGCHMPATLHLGRESPIWQLACSPLVLIQPFLL